jgi:hypothetical protein
MSTTKKKITKKKLLEVLKGEPREFDYTKDTVLEWLKNPPTQEEWLRGYWRWRKQKKGDSC